MELFRPEAVEAANGSPFGETLEVHWVGTKVLTSVALAVCTGLLIFAVVVDFSPTYRFSAQFNTRSGAAVVRSNSEGRISKLLVDNGAKVTQNQAILVLETDTGLRTGGYRGERTSTKVHEQIKALSEQILAIQHEEQAYGAKSARMVSSLEEKVRQQRKIEQLHEDVGERFRAQEERIAELVGQGFMSRFQGEQKANELREHEIKSANIKAELINLKGEIASIADDVEISRARFRAKSFELQGALKEAEKLLIETESQTRQVLYATQTGSVYFENINKGQSVSKNQPIYTIVIDDEPLIAKLSVTPEALSLLTVGSVVSLAVNGYPPEEHGFMQAIVHSINLTPEAEPINGKPVYTAMAELKSDTISSKFALHPGLSAEAVVSGQGKSLFKWLFPTVVQSVRVRN